MAEILIPADDRREQYVATAGQTVFPYNYPIFFETDLTIWRTNATPLPPALAVTDLLVLGVDYTVTGVRQQNGGDVILTTPSQDGDLITVESVTIVDRLTDFQQAGDFFSSDVNLDYDRIVTMIQERKREIERSLRLRPEDPSVDLFLPVASVRALNFLAFDEFGNARAVRNLDTNLVPVTTYMQVVLLADDAAEARLFLDAQEDVITTQGDLVLGNASNVADRLGIGANNTFLKSDGTTALWSGLPIASTSTAGIIEIATQGEVNNGSGTNLAVTSTTLESTLQDSPRTAKAWVNFAFGSPNPTIRDDYNVSSVTEISTGSYRINFSSNFPTDNYSMTAGTGGGVPFAVTPFPRVFCYINDLRTNSCGVETHDVADIPIDSALTCVTIHGSV